MTNNVFDTNVVLRALAARKTAMPVSLMQDLRAKLGPSGLPAFTQAANEWYAANYQDLHFTADMTHNYGQAVEVFAAGIVNDEPDYWAYLRPHLKPKAQAADNKTADIAGGVAADDYGDFHFGNPLAFEDLPSDLQDKAVERNRDINVLYDTGYIAEEVSDSYVSNMRDTYGLDATVISAGTNPIGAEVNFSLENRGLFVPQFARWVAQETSKRSATVYDLPRVVYRALLEGMLDVWYTNGSAHVKDYAEYGLADEYRAAVDWDTVVQNLDYAVDSFFKDLEHQLGTRLAAEYEYLTSDEAVRDSLVGREFNDDGTLAGLAYKNVRLADIANPESEPVPRAEREFSAEFESFTSALRAGQMWYADIDVNGMGRYLFVVDPTVVERGKTYVDLRSGRGFHERKQVEFVRLAAGFWSRVGNLDSEYVQEWLAYARRGGALRPTVYSYQTPLELRSAFDAQQTTASLDDLVVNAEDVPIVRPWYRMCRERARFAGLKLESDIATQHATEYPTGRRIKTTYQTVTPESAEHGDFADQGWKNEEGDEIEIYISPDEPSEFDQIVAETVRYLQREGAYGTSSSEWDAHVWYESGPMEDYATAAQTFYNYHLEGYTADESRAVFMAMKGRAASLKFSDIANPPGVARTHDELAAMLHGGQVWRLSNGWLLYTSPDARGVARKDDSFNKQHRLELLDGWTEPPSKSEALVVSEVQWHSVIVVNALPAVLVGDWQEQDGKLVVKPESSVQHTADIGGSKFMAVGETVRSVDEFKDKVVPNTVWYNERRGTYIYVGNSPLSIQDEGHKIIVNPATWASTTNDFARVPGIVAGNLLLDDSSFPLTLVENNWQSAFPPKRESSLVYTAADEQGTKSSIFIALDVPDAVRDAYSHIDGLEDDLHVTLLYVPDARLSDKQKEDVLEAISKVARQYKPLDCNTTGIGNFDNGDNTLVAFINIPVGAALYTDLEDAVTDVYGTWDKQYGWLPHMTLRYEDEGESDLDDLRDTEWQADYLRVSFSNDDQQVWHVVLGTGDVQRVEHTATDKDDDKAKASALGFKYADIASASTARDARELETLAESWDVWRPADGPLLYLGANPVVSVASPFTTRVSPCVMFSLSIDDNLKRLAHGFSFSGTYGNKLLFPAHRVGKWDPNEYLAPKPTAGFKYSDIASINQVANHEELHRVISSWDKWRIQSTGRILYVGQDPKLFALRNSLTYIYPAMVGGITVTEFRDLVAGIRSETISSSDFPLLWEGKWDPAEYTVGRTASFKYSDTVNNKRMAAFMWTKTYGFENGGRVADWACRTCKELVAEHTNVIDLADNPLWQDGRCQLCLDASIKAQAVADELFAQEKDKPYEQLVHVNYDTLRDLLWGFYRRGFVQPDLYRILQLMQRKGMVLPDELQAIKRPDKLSGLQFTSYRLVGGTRIAREIHDYVARRLLSDVQPAKVVSSLVFKPVSKTATYVTMQGTSSLLGEQPALHVDVPLADTHAFRTEGARQPRIPYWVAQYGEELSPDELFYETSRGEYTPAFDANKSAGLTVLYYRPKRKLIVGREPHDVLVDKHFPNIKERAEQQGSYSPDRDDNKFFSGRLSSDGSVLVMWNPEVASSAPDSFVDFVFDLINAGYLKPTGWIKFAYGAQATPLKEFLTGSKTAAIAQPVRDQLDYPDYSNAAKRAVERAGAIYEGEQDYGSRGLYVWFRDPQNNSSLMLPSEGLTVEQVAEHLEKNRAKEW